MTARVLVVVHPRLGSPDELLSAVAGAEIHAVVFGAADPHSLVAAGVQGVHTVAHALTDTAHVEALADAVARIAGDLHPGLVLINHTPLGADLAPRIAFHLDGDAATGCVVIACHADRFHCTRPRQGGIAHEVLSYARGPVVATLRAGNYPAAPRDATRTGTVRAFEYTPAADAVRATLVERREETAGAGPRLEDARVIVAGGRGLDGPEGFSVLQDLARAIDGVVGASRVPCDLGWCPRSWQIGLTGKTVTPELYIAVGISGASHHMAGCGNARAIVAINTDREAAIFRDARFGLAADYRALLPALVAELSKPQTG